MAVDQLIPPTPLSPWLRPIQTFLRTEAAGGLILLACAVAAMVWANSPWGDGYFRLWHTYIGVGVPDSPLYLKLSLAHWINDGLMVVFFLLVGLEIKRELLFGELASPRRAALPIAAALGGMVVPASIYTLVNLGGSHPEAMNGWGIPMATDIAFAVGVLALVGNRVPLSLKVFLLAIAIVDDLGAVLVIALFYTESVSLTALGAAAVCLAVLVALNLLRVQAPLMYLVVGVFLWLATLASGVHATVAGVLLAMAIPGRRLVEERPYLEYARQMLDQFARDTEAFTDRLTTRQSHALHALEQASQAVQAPLARVEHALLGPVNFVIMPLFALANAGVAIGGDVAAVAAHPVTLGVALGLAFGKPIGVVGFSLLAVGLGLATKPRDGTWKQIVGISLLCGIGFTMSLFIANLAFPGDHGGASPLLDHAKLGTLGGSLVMGVLGFIVLRRGKPLPAASTDDLETADEH